MPVSVETVASVNAALRESLGSTGVSCSQAANAKASVADETKTNGSSSAADDVDTLHGKLVASAKRVLLSKIDYEEVTNYGQTVLDSLKSKYIVLKPLVNNNSVENGRNSPATCNNNNNNSNNGANGDSAADANGNASAAAVSNGGTPIKRPPNPNELPAPKRVLYPRENVRIGWKSTGRKWDVGVGMMNVGNTCYLNSTLQAVFHVPSMANWLMSDSAHMERCESTDSGCIICAMAKTLQASQNNQSAIRPYFVYSKLKSICKHLVMGRQEDAHEFLRYLVEAMEKSYLSRFRNFKELDQYSKETTPMNQILGGYLKSSVKCLSCNHVSVTFQHFQDLLLDIRKADTIDEALEGYFSRERLEDMGYKCEACKKKVSATKQFSLERAPIALCIQLKRFSMLGTKINKQITIKPRLDLTKFALRKIPGEQLTYRLVAMVTHLGASQHCGHYTAIGLTESGTYYNYDDSYVRPISMQNVCNTNAYIIFYEMDTQPPRQVTCTQVSGAQSTNTMTSTPKLNGHAVGSNSQRLIGPQLPPSFSNGNTSPLRNGCSKLILNRNATTTSSSSSTSPLTSNNSKIMIHFKNNNATTTSNSPVVKMSAATSSITSASATSSTSPSNNNSAFDNLKNGVSNNQNYTSNGLHVVGTGKFQDSTSAKCSLGVPTNKRQINNAKNGNESSSDDDDENEIVSSSTPIHNPNSQAATLPSMPKLCVESNNNNNSNSITTSIKPPLSNGISKKSPAPIKSLVPYGSETDEEPDVIVAATATSTGEQEKRLLSNPLKRRQSSSSWSSSSSASDNDDENDKDSRPTTGIKIKKAASSTTTSASTAGCGGSLKSPVKISLDSTSCLNGVSKKSSDTIDNIFNSIKRSTNVTTTSTNGGVSPQKKKSQNNQQFTVTSTTPTTTDSFSSASNSDSEDNTKSLSSSRPQFKRSHSTPPSPPVVKTNSGIWQVTSLHPVSACVSPTTDKVPPPKNPKNPFASKPMLFAAGGDNAKRLKKEPSNKIFAGNGYQGGTEATNNSGISELLKHSHRGYGAPVLTWNGQQSEIDRENYYLFDEKRIEDDNNDNTNNHNNVRDIVEYAADNKPQHNYDDAIQSNDSLSHQYNNNNSACDLILEENIQRIHSDIDLKIDSKTAISSNDFMDEFNDDDFSVVHTQSSSTNQPFIMNENSSTSNSLNRRHNNLHLDLNILNNNDNCLPLHSTTLPHSCTKLNEDARIGERKNIDSCSSADGDGTTDEHIQKIHSSSSAKTEVINPYCLSPNSTDNEPTTPTLATTINDIIFQFSDDSLDNL